jgi:hypothetical protein
VRPPCLLTPIAKPTDLAAPVGGSLAVVRLAPLVLTRCRHASAARDRKPAQLAPLASLHYCPRTRPPIQARRCAVPCALFAVAHAVLMPHAQARTFDWYRCPCTRPTSRVRSAPARRSSGPACAFPPRVRARDRAARAGVVRVRYHATSRAGVRAPATRSRRPTYTLSSPCPPVTSSPPAADAPRPTSLSVLVRPELLALVAARVSPPAPPSSSARRARSAARSRCRCRGPRSAARARRTRPARHAAAADAASPPKHRTTRPRRSSGGAAIAPRSRSQPPRVR